MLWTIISILFAIWLISLLMHVASPLIHLILVVAVVLFVVNLLTGRRTVILDSAGAHRRFRNREDGRGKLPRYGQREAGISIGSSPASRFVAGGPHPA